MSLAEALIDDPFYQAVTVEFSGDKQKQQQILARYFELAAEEATGIGEVHSAGDDGAAIWLTNEASDSDVALFNKAREQALSSLLGNTGFDNYARISRSMEKQLPARLLGAWYLSILGVRPAARGQRLAQHLLELTLSRADQQGAICYLETFNPLSLPFYRRLGFNQEIHCIEAVTGSQYWILTRH